MQASEAQQNKKPKDAMMQFNMRVKASVADAYRSYCKNRGITQSEGLQLLLTGGRNPLKKSTSRLLNEKQPIPQLCVKAAEIQPILEDLVLHRELVSSGGNIYPMQTFAQEDETAQKIAAMLTAKPEPVDITLALDHIRSELGIQLSQ